MSDQARTISGRYVFPIEGPPIPEGRVTIAGGKLVRVGPPDDDYPVDRSLGNVAILPGFVNAHTHLDLAQLPGPDDGTVEDEVEWLRRVIASRVASGPDSGMANAERNVLASLRAGTTTIADTSAGGQSWGVVAASPLRGIVFHEILGLNRVRGLQTSEAAFDWLARVDSGDPERRLRAGFSPHAPYSTAGWLYHRAVAGGVPLSTHLAEMPEEIELLATRTGALRGFLEDLGAWDEDWEPIGPRPADYIRREGLREADWIVAHANYFDPSELWQLRPNAAPDGHRVAVAYCPRTAARFGHSPHPYRAMLDRGIVVCLGTDSLASSPTLSILDEARFLHRHDETASGDLLLTMATLFGAWALRLDHRVGSLKPGKAADLAVIGLSEREDVDPYRLVLDSEGSVLATMIDGRFVHGPWML